jgi:formylglycine-generating enzyme required for sulfatase activity
MSALSCPKCQCLVQTPAGSAASTRCPTCGTRLACSHCGAALSGTGGRAGVDRCPRCALDLEEGDAQTSVAPTQLQPTTPRIDLPGFELHGELGRGGMGVVYAATQHSLNRRVALKVLAPALAGHPELIERFRNEAAVAASLMDAHILPVFDVLEVGGVPVLVLPLVVGTDLGRIVRARQAAWQGQPPPQSHPWAALDDRAYLDRILPLLDQVVAAVTAMHAAHVLHRDIKPGNVLVDGRGHAWLSDFGLARFEEHGAGTAPGLALGTVAYRSPEQARAEELDGRSDVFSLAATLYQALVLELPYGKAGAHRASPPPVPPSRRQPLLSRDFDGVLLKALAPEPAERYPSTAEFQQDWRRVRQGLPPRARPPGPARRLARAARRHPWQAATALALLLLLCLTPVALRPGPPAAPPVPAAAERTVRLTTEPAGARVVLVPLDPDTRAPRPEAALRTEDRTPLTLEHVPAGEYLVVAEAAGHGFHEVYRVVPVPGAIPDADFRHTWWVVRPDGTVELPPIDIPPAGVPDGMAYFAGGEFTMGSPHVQGSPPHRRRVAPFYLDATEVTAGAYGRRARRPGGNEPGAPADWAVNRVSFDAALDYAERIGKRLPDEAEYEYAATGGGTRDFPWGGLPQRIAAWPLGPVRQPAFDRLNTDPPVYGLYSNVAEWTTTRLYPYPTDDPLCFAMYHSPGLREKLESIVVRGGPFSAIQGQPAATELALIVPPNPAVLSIGPRSRLGIKREEAYPGLGFRCARSARPRFLDR